MSDEQDDILEREDVAKLSHRQLLERVALDQIAFRKEVRKFMSDQSTWTGSISKKVRSLENWQLGLKVAWGFVLVAVFALWNKIEPLFELRFKD